MKFLPRLGRRLRHPVLRPALLAALIMTLGSGSAALASPTPAAWPFEWRPNWIPGDPIDAGRATLEMPWIAPGPLAPGLLVALDPVTRLPIKPSPAQRAAAAAALEAAGSLVATDGPLPVDHIPGGGEIVHLQGRFQIFAVARRGADGRFTMNCTEPKREAK